MSWSEYVDIGMGVLNLGSTIRSSNKADDLTGASEGLVNQEIARNSELADLYATGGTSISNAIGALSLTMATLGKSPPILLTALQTSLLLIVRARKRETSVRSMT